MLENTLINGDALNVMKKIGDNQIDAIYLDPPFYTQDIQNLHRGKMRKNIAFLTDGIAWMNI